MGIERRDRAARLPEQHQIAMRPQTAEALHKRCLLYTSDAADERSSVDLGGRRIIKKKKQRNREGGKIVELKNNQQNDIRTEVLEHMRKEK